MTQYMHTIVAGTGHRPDKLGGYGDDVFDRLVRLAAHALRRLEPTRVISGMALGWDQALAQAAANLRIPFDAYLPFAGQESKWPAGSQAMFKYLLRLARQTRVVCEGGYAAWKMQRRNEAMVDDAGVVLALFDGSAGGTGNCVRYAHARKRPVLNVWGRWEAGDY